MWGERISHHRPDDCYFAHLSIYRFASVYCREARILDAGCGSGYGAAYLAQQGAAWVCGVDGDRDAIASCSGEFNLSNLQFRTTDLRRIEGFEDHSIDVIVASNSLEHIVGVESFFRSAIRLLKPEGLLITAVPAPLSKRAVAEELGNLHHVNLWSPRHWYRVHNRYFGRVRCYSHVLTRPGVVLDFNRKPEETVIRETDFDFPETETVDGMYRPDTHTALFVCSNPLAEENLPGPDWTETTTDHSLSRGNYPALLQPLLWAYYRVSYVWRYEGFLAVLKRAVRKIHETE